MSSAYLSTPYVACIRRFGVRGYYQQIDSSILGMLRSLMLLLLALASAPMATLAAPDLDKWLGRSVYFVVTDRFARDDDAVRRWRRAEVEDPQPHVQRRRIAL